MSSLRTDCIFYGLGSEGWYMPTVVSMPVRASIPNVVEHKGEVQPAFFIKEKVEDFSLIKNPRETRSTKLGILASVNVLTI